MALQLRRRASVRTATRSLSTTQPCACIAASIHLLQLSQPRVKYERPHCQPAHMPALLCPVFMETPHQSRETYELYKYKGWASKFQDLPKGCNQAPGPGLDPRSVIKCDFGKFHLDLFLKAPLLSDVISCWPDGALS